MPPQLSDNKPMARYELKFKLNANQVHKVREILSTLCVADSIHPCYPVLSRYFDDAELTDWQTKIEGELAHKKIRLRTYANQFTPEHATYLEAKVKVDHRTSKIRQLLTRPSYLMLPQSGVDPLLQREFDRRSLWPICDVSYDRRAFYCEDQARHRFRLTIDTNLRFRCIKQDERHLPILPSGQAILEIKSEQQELPPAITRFLYAMNLRRQTFSKYVAAVDHIKQLETEGMWIPS
jgi:hypothetical protein